MPTPVLSGAFVLATVEWFKYLRSTIFIKIVALTDTVYTDLMIFLTALLVPAFTVMILFEGYKIITGQTTEPAATYVLKWLKITILASIATYSGLKNLELQYFISESQSAISVVLTKNTDLFANVDKRLTTTATLAGAITGFVNRTSGGDQVAKLVTVVAGNAGAVMPIITALATHTALQIFLKVGIMLAPIFVFAGMFEKTSDWPITWAKYMFGTMLTLALMALMSDLVFDIVGLSGAAMVTAYLLGTGALYLSLLSAIEGLFLSLLLITVPGFAMKLLSLASEGVAGNALGSAPKRDDSNNNNNNSNNSNQRQPTQGVSVIIRR